jgi:hypothetical protein
MGASRGIQLPELRFLPSQGPFQVLLPASPPQFLDGRVQKNDGKSGGFEKRCVLRLGKRPSAQGHNPGRRAQTGEQFAESFLLRNPESRFPSRAKDLRDGLCLPSLNAVVEILELPAQLAAQNLSDTGLACAHEAHQE